MNVKRAYKKRTTRPKRKVVRKRKFAGKFGNPRAMAPSANNYAKVTETVTYENLTPNTMYSALAVLADTTRSLALATSFQWYRITSVEWKYKPFYNTFQDGATTGVPTKPQFYMIMNRNGNFPALTLSQLEEQGARARDFTRDLIVKYKPNTLVVAGIANNDGTTIGQANEVRMNAWLPCGQTGPLASSNNWSSVPYYGHQFYIQQDIVSTAPTTTVATIELSMVIEFKNPGLYNPTPSPAITRVTPVH